MVERKRINSSAFRVLCSEFGIPRTQNAGRRTHYEKLIQEVEEIYDWLESQIDSRLSGECGACGQCCDFIAYDHRLYVTVPELIYLAAKLNVDSFKPMTSGVCPYNIEKKCTVHEYRFSGCRIFNCKANADIQSQLSEAVLKKLKELCSKYEIPYRYIDLASAMNNDILA